MRKRKMMIKLLLFALFVVGCSANLSTPDPNHMAFLKSLVWVNPQDVEASVNFMPPYADPYPQSPVPGGYDTEINTKKNCYLVFMDDSRTSYKLLSLPEKAAMNMNESGGSKGLVYLTHEKPCGVCSSTHSLALYMEELELTKKVGLCAAVHPNDPFELFKCMLGIGFKDDGCLRIWLQNVGNTGGRSLSQGGCMEVCHYYQTIWAPQQSSIIARIIEPAIDGTDDGALFQSNVNWCDPAVCENTINGFPLCTPPSYLVCQGGSTTPMDGCFRLHPCLQCDECRSGPIFQKIAGRTRRNSGVAGDIPRPFLPPVIDHTYGYIPSPP